MRDRVELRSADVHLGAARQKHGVNLLERRLQFAQLRFVKIERVDEFWMLPAKFGGVGHEGRHFGDRLRNSADLFDPESTPTGES